jgi:hypothetical protein
MNKIIVVTMSLFLAGCGAAVDLAGVLVSATVLDYTYNNSSYRRMDIDDRPRCPYIVSPNVTRVDICPPGVLEGTPIYK